jgi:hypothetical protein
MAQLAELLERWDSGEGKPYKGRLIDWDAFEADKSNIGCMCAQGQVLHLLGNWSPKRLANTEQEKADKATAKLLNISIAHSILLRSVNDKADGAPSVLTHPEKILGDQAHIVLAFWLHLDRMKAKDWGTLRGPLRGTLLRGRCVGRCEGRCVGRCEGRCGGRCEGRCEGRCVGRWLRLR